MFGQASGAIALDDAEKTLADRVQKIEVEYKTAVRAGLEAKERAALAGESKKPAGVTIEDERLYIHKLLELAESAPGSAGALQALLLVIEDCDKFLQNPFHDELGRAMTMLARHHGDDPEAIRLGLSLDNWMNESSDTLLRRFYASARGREAKGLARLALAQFLERKIGFVQHAREVAGRLSFRFDDGFDGEGKPLGEVRVPQSDEQYAYKLHLETCDPEVLRRETLRLYEEVIDEFGDIRCLTVRDRKFQRALEDRMLDGRSLTEDGDRRLRVKLERVPTLAEAARARLDGWLNLAVGKLAPEIVGTDFEGKPLKLSQFRGKALLLVFWGTWCGPCMAELPHERELVERYQGRPFTVLGVNCGDLRERALRTIESERITWPNWFDGEEPGGPIATQYHVQGFPTMYIIDHDGVIRSRDLRGKPLDELIETLVKAAEGG
jgi:thiol-disulfide isomerase/thioredoxin